MRKSCLWVVAILLVLIQGLVQASSLPAPSFRPGQHIYTIPRRFTPPLLGRQGMRDLERRARSLHYPFYVVIVQDFTGATTKDMANAVDGIAAEWSGQDGYDVGRSSLLLWSIHPPKYRFLGGSRWKNQFGISGESYRPFTDRFVQSMKGTPKDPKNGISNTMRGVDAFLFDRTDPKRIAARREAQRREALAKRQAELREQAVRKLEDAHSKIDREISQTEALLADKRYLPGNISSYVDALKQAKRVQSSSNISALLLAANSLSQKNSELAGFVDQRRREATAALVSRIEVGLVVLVILVLVTYFLWKRWYWYSSGRRRFNEKVGTWSARITNAGRQYLAFYGERDSVAGLSDMKGKTADHYAMVTAEIDGIYTLVEAMGGRVKKLQAQASEASFWNLGPLVEAGRLIDLPFDYDTGQLNQKYLFGSVTETITIDPKVFVAEMEGRFTRTKTEWEELNEAAKLRFQPAEEHFPSSTLEDFIRQLDAEGIPHRWVEDHPLFGDDESDHTLYDRINECRWNDPYSYREQLIELKVRQGEIVERVGQLLEAVKKVRNAHLDASPQVAETVLLPKDDPAVLFAEARAGEDIFKGLLARGRDVIQVVTRAETVARMYQDCQELATNAAVAIDKAEQVVAEAREEVESTKADKRAAVETYEATGRVHSNIEAPAAALTAADKHFVAAQNALTSAERKLAEKRHVEALSTGRNAEQEAGNAKQKYGSVIEACGELDRQKQAYEKALADMEHRRLAAAQRLAQYGGSPQVLRVYQPMQTGSSVLDYAILASLLNQHQQSWDETVRAQRQLYEAQQAQIRADQEAAAEAARREAASQVTYDSPPSPGVLDTIDTSSIGGDIGGGGGGGSDSIGGDLG